MKVELLSYTPNPDKLVAIAAKLCYSKVGVDGIQEKLTDKDIERFLNALMEMGHESPLEHVNFTFAIEGVSRVLEQQLTRHRIASYSIQSGRYVKRENPDFYISESISSNEKALQIYLNTCNECVKAYNQIFDLLLQDYCEQFFNTNIAEIYYENKGTYIEYVKINNKAKYNDFTKKAMENARYIFPNSLETKIIFTMNARELLHVFEKRCCERSQDEIKELANKMLLLVKKVAPVLFKYAGASCVKGKCPEGSMSCGKSLV